MCKFHNYYAHKAHRCAPPCAWSENWLADEPMVWRPIPNMPLPRLCIPPANAGLTFLTDKLTNDRYLVDTGATLSIVPCSQNASPSGPLLKGADAQPIPSWGFIKKTGTVVTIRIDSYMRCCGELPTPLETVKPVRRTLVKLKQCLYINRLLSINKLMLLYLLLRLLPQCLRFMDAIFPGKLSAIFIRQESKHIHCNPGAAF
jgi:hypothetical protein